MNSSPTIAILHGWATDPLVLEPVKTQLETRGHKVTLYEMPGYGSRQPQRGANSIEALADDAVVKLADHDIWLGWSLGAMVTLSVAAKNPAFLQGIVAVCPTAKFCCDEAKAESLSVLQRSVKENATKAVKRFHRSLPSSENRRKTAKALGTPSVSGNGSTASQETLLGGLDILARADLSEEVNKIGIPVRLISGTGDAIIPASSGEALRDLIPDSQYTALPCGHLPFLECPELFMEQLFEFTQTIAESTASQKPV